MDTSQQKAACCRWNKVDIMFMLKCDTPALGIIEHKFTCTGNANPKVNFAIDQKHTATRK